MTNRKLDMGKAWTQTTALIGSNRDTISAIAGLFFFLPSFASALLVPELSNPPQPSGPSGADPAVAMRALLNQITAIYAANWPLLLGLSIVQFVGSMSLFALLTDRSHPTVREALATGLRSIPTYIAAQLLTAIGAGIAIGLPLSVVAAFAPPAAALLVLLAGLVVLVYVFIKFALIAPVIAIEGERNPISAIRRSWQLTKGNSFRIFLFLFLLIFTIGIIAALVTGTLGLILSAFGEPVATIGTDVVGGLVNALFTVIILVVTVAIHRQLAGASPEALATEFE